MLKSMKWFVLLAALSSAVISPSLYASDDDIDMKEKKRKPLTKKDVNPRLAKRFKKWQRAIRHAPGLFDGSNEEEEGQINLLTLPNEILAQILDYLPGPHFQCISMSCTRLYAVSEYPGFYLRGLDLSQINSWLANKTTWADIALKLSRSPIMDFPQVFYKIAQEGQGKFVEKSAGRGSLVFDVEDFRQWRPYGFALCVASMLGHKDAIRKTTGLFKSYKLSLPEITAAFPPKALYLFDDNNSNASTLEERLFFEEREAFKELTHPTESLKAAAVKDFDRSNYWRYFKSSIHQDSRLHNYKKAARGFYWKAKRSLDAQEEYTFYKKVVELYEKLLERLCEKATPEDYEETGYAYFNAAKASSDPRGKYTLFKKAAEFYEKQIALLGEKATPENYKNAAAAFQNAADACSDAEEKEALSKRAEELTWAGRARRKLMDIVQLRPYFDVGYLAIKNANYETILGFAENPKYKASFSNYSGGVFIKRWKASAGFDPLLDLLINFALIKSFKVRIEWGQEGNTADLISRSLQFFEALEKLDISNCGLTDANIQDILDSIPNPDKLKVLDMRNNNLGEDAQEKLQNHFKNLTRLKC